jgi:hypothetical protein
MLPISRVKFCFNFLVGFYAGVIVFSVFKIIHQPQSSHYLQSSKNFDEIESLYSQDVSQKLFNDIKIFCIVITNPNSHKTKAIHVKNTWGKRCNKLIFTTTEIDAELDTISLNLNESRRTLRKKVKASFLHAHKHYLHEFDWFMKADDDK